MRNGVHFRKKRLSENLSPIRESVERAKQRPKLKARTELERTPLAQLFDWNEATKAKPL